MALVGDVGCEWTYRRRLHITCGRVSSVKLVLIGSGSSTADLAVDQLGIMGSSAIDNADMLAVYKSWLVHSHR